MKKGNALDEKLKIAVIGHKRIPTREGGIEIVVHELSVRMARQGHTVEVYNRRGSHVSGKRFANEIGKNYQGVRILSIPTFENGNLNAIVYSFLASLRALFGNYDVFHYHAEGSCAMLWIPKMFGKKIVVTIHGLDWQRSKWGGLATQVLKFGEKLAVKYADEIIVLSANMRDYFKTVYGRDTRFIPNGIVRPDLVEAVEIAKEWGLQKEEYILFLARIVPEKGAHYLIEAYRQITTDKKLVIAGGSSHSSNYYSRLKEMAAGDSRIIFTDFVGGRWLEELYSNTYAFVLPSDVEGMAIGLLEAMSYGNCCIVSDICENTEVVGDYAIKFTKGNVNDLRDKLNNLINHPERCRQYQSKAADYICEKYNWEDIVARTLDLYYSIR